MSRIGRWEPALEEPLLIRKRGRLHGSREMPQDKGKWKVITQAQQDQGSKNLSDHLKSFFFSPKWHRKTYLIKCQIMHVHHLFLTEPNQTDVIVLQCNLLFYWRAYDQIQILHTLSQEFGTSIPGFAMSTRTMVSLITTKSFSSWRSGIPKPFRDKVPTLENISMTSCTSSSSDFFWWPTIRVSTTAKAYTKMNKKMRTWIESGSNSEKKMCV